LAYLDPPIAKILELQNKISTLKTVGSLRGAAQARETPHSYPKP